MTQSSLRNLLEAMAGEPITDEAYSSLVRDFSQMEDPDKQEGIKLISYEGLFRFCSGVLRIDKVRS